MGIGAVINARIVNK